MNRSLGRFGESWAAGLLARRGYRLLARNVRFRTGEIDIVAMDGDVLVFVEVKTRRSSTFGPPESAITRARYAHLEAAIGEYLARREDVPESYRIDVVVIEVAPSGSVSRCEVFANVECPVD